MKYRLTIKTIKRKNVVLQEITYKNFKEWFDTQLKLNLIRGEIEEAIKLDLPFLRKVYYKNKTKVFYSYQTDFFNLNEFDGNWFVNYRKPKKTCRNCISYSKKEKHCSWKDEIILKEIVFCDGFQEK